MRAKAAADTTTAKPPARWWDTMQDPELTRLVDMALARSPTLAAARARILEARAALTRQRAALYPSATATAATAKGAVPASGALGGIAGGSSNANSNGAGAGAGAQQQGAAAGAGNNGAAQSSDHTHLSFYTAGFDATWEIDIFGGVRRGIEGARAQAEAAAARYEDSQVQLAAEVGQAYVNLRGAQLRLALARRDSALQRQLLQLAQERARIGTSSDLDVLRLEVQVQQTVATAVPLVAQVEEGMDQLALLTAQEPGALDNTLMLSDQLALISVPLPPAEVAIGNPAELLRRRPDIRAAERALAASSAAIGQAVAALYPTITLYGNVGFSSSTTSDFFSRRNLAVVGAPLLRWNFLNFGSTRAQIRQARASNQEALAQFDSTVLSALQDAETSLSRYGHQRDNVLQLGRSRDAAARAESLARLRFKGGTASLTDALDAERQRLQTEQGLAQARAQLSVDFVSLQKSLGLGWQPLADDGLADAKDGSAGDNDNDNAASVVRREPPLASR